eukprot:2220536-Alexandrium_andersonii.AAC.1
MSVILYVRALTLGAITSVDCLAVSAGVPCCTSYDGALEAWWRISCPSSPPPRRCCSQFFGRHVPNVVL